MIAQLKKGEQAIKDFAKTTPRLGIVGAIENAVNSAKSKLSELGNHKVDLGGLATSITAGVAAVTAGLIALGIASIKSLDSLGEEATQAGTTADKFRGLGYALQLSGSDAGSLGGALLKMNKELGDAAAKGDKTENAFRKIGLSAKELKTLDPTEAFKRIAEAIKALPTPAEKAAAAMSIFGKSGGQLLNTLNQGQEGLDALTQEFIDMGGALGAGGQASVEAAADALDKIGFAAQAAGGQIAVAIAPAIVALSEKIVGLTKYSGQFGEIFNRVLDAVNSALQIAVVAVFGLYGAFKGLQAIVSGVGSAIAFALAPLIGNDVGEALAKLSEEQGSAAAGAFDELFASTEKVNGFFEGLKTGAGEAAEALDKTDTSSKRLAESVVEMTTKIGDMESKLRLEIDTLGMSSEAKEIYKLKTEGATDAMVAEVTRLSEELRLKKELADLEKSVTGKLQTKLGGLGGRSAEQVEIDKFEAAGGDPAKVKNFREVAAGAEELEKQKKASDKAKADLQDRAKDLIKETTSPLEKFAKDLKELRDLKTAGLIDNTTLGRGVAKAQKELSEKSSSDDASKEFEKSLKNINAPVLEVGSAEARSALLSHGREDPLQQLGIQQVTELKGVNVLLAKIENKVGRGEVPFAF